MVHRISAEIKQFILQTIDSIAQWEGLLLMRAHPEEKWNDETLARNLYIEKEEATLLLEQLLVKGFLTHIEQDSSSFYQYRPNSEDIEKMVQECAELYRKYLVPMTNLIHSKPKNRIQEFADAFRIRKE